MKVREEIHGAERLLFACDEETGLRAVVAMHRTTLGPALGGCRWARYGSEAEAVRDARRLALGMTYKNAMAGVPYSGGKAVVFGPRPQEAGDASRAFRTLGRFIEDLQGRYITGMDLGTSVREMDWIRQETSYVTDTTGSLGANGEFTADMTAYGVYLGIRASLCRAYGSETMTRRIVAVQGLGKVGFALCRYLREAGADLIVADVQEERARKAAAAYGARVVDPDEIARTACDVFAPCALGGGLGEETIPALRCAIVAGAANNQLADDFDGERLQQRGILYAPDYVVNAGGILVTAVELAGGTASMARRRVAGIRTTIDAVFSEASRHGISPAAAADRLARSRFSLICG